MSRHELKQAQPIYDKVRAIGQRDPVDTYLTGGYGPGSIPRFSQTLKDIIIGRPEDKA